MKIPGIKKIPLTSFEKKSNASADKLARESTARVNKFAKGKKFGGPK